MPFYRLSVDWPSVLNPLLCNAAELAVDASAGGNTVITQAANGVPIVNIAAPNRSGLSHNKFTDYNVGQQGLILNEVTGCNQSQLKGYTEVAGQSAHAVVANPHGITCDGCGFINTPRVSLSTGAPVIEAGQLRQFNVDGGQIVIDGAGLNAANISQFDLITRRAKLNAAILRSTISIKLSCAGCEKIKATNRSLFCGEEESSVPNSVRPRLALGVVQADVAKLAGLGQIRPGTGLDNIQALIQRMIEVPYPRVSHQGLPATAKKVIQQR